MFEEFQAITTDRFWATSRPDALIDALDRTRQIAGYDRTSDHMDNIIARARVAGVPLPEGAMMFNDDEDGLPLIRIDDVAVVPISGFMTKRDSLLSWLTGGRGTNAIRRAVERIGADDRTKRLILKIDSPGGSVDGIAELGDAIFKARDTTHIVAQIDGVATSAAYWAGSQAHEVVMGRLDETGSIGVRLLLYDYSKMFEAEGVRPVLVDTGAFKSTGALGVEITDEQEKELRKNVDTYFVAFKQTVERGRNMLGSEVDDVADGRIFIGQDAIDRGLADRIQTFDETLAEMRAAGVAEREAAKRTASAVAVAKLGTTIPLGD